ncbi:MAG: toxin-antitoxin system HicB family antitoxin [Calditrichaeota bacterium]|nr:MAG: toxin-antitoxin system HicB family antitoxin [Calditrichota bacterium]
MSTLSIRIPDYLHEQVKNLAANEKISINQFITLALAEKLSALMTEDYIKEREKRASKDKFIKALNQVPDFEPEEYDRL